MQLPRWTWLLLKGVLVGAILGGVTYHFARLLGSADWRQTGWPLRPGWLALSGVLYLGGLGFSSLLWLWLLYSLGERPGLAGTLRAYYLGQLGRYVPGKVVAVALRASLLRQAGVRPSLGAPVIVYEALTTIVAGALLAAVLFPFLEQNDFGNRWRLLGVLVVLGILLVPRVFNRVVQALVRCFRKDAEAALPGLRLPTVAAGLALAGCGWWLHGAAVWCGLKAVMADPVAFTGETWAKCTAFYALAQAIAFCVVLVPGGLGVRELLLQQLLAAGFATALGVHAAHITAVAVLLLRLAWTAADLLAAAAAYWLRSRADLAGSRPMVAAARDSTGLSKPVRI
jgi:hypothetical protein